MYAGTETEQERQERKARYDANMQATYKKPLSQK